LSSGLGTETKRPLSEGGNNNDGERGGGGQGHVSETIRGARIDFASGLLVGAVLSAVVTAALGPTILVAFFVRGIGAVAGSDFGCGKGWSDLAGGLFLWTIGSAVFRAARGMSVGVTSLIWGIGAVAGSDDGWSDLTGGLFLRTST
jgi:hypothetical protein